MEYFVGTPASGGLAIGSIYFFEREKQSIQKFNVSDTKKEKEFFFAACKKAKAQLTALYEDIKAGVKDDAADIFLMHIMMLEDDDFTDAVVRRIVEKKQNAAWAVSEAAPELRQILASVDDEYISSRTADVDDITHRLILILNEQHAALIQFDQPVIIAANDLRPSETVLFDRNKILGFVTTEGSRFSHTAILARSLGVPAVLGTGFEFSVSHSGLDCIVDGEKGHVYISPDEAAVKEAQKQQKLLKKEYKKLQGLRGAQSISSTGKKIEVFANAGSLEDIDAALENDAEGIGLFRSEFLYLGKTSLPAEEELFTVYRHALEKMQGKKIVIRTLDIGADKQAQYLTDYFGLQPEENPALGMRAIRLYFKKPEIFTTQLRAILRASAFGKAAIMFPMLISVDEAKRLKAMLAKVQDDLRAEKIAFDEHIEAGIMIETPAAALIADDLAGSVDFFSIGTNDLTQYTLAIDRQNKMLADYYDLRHKAVLRLIEMTAAAAHKQGIWVGICGELGSDINLTQFFLDLGIDELSVYPAAVLPVRKKVTECC